MNKELLFSLTKKDFEIETMRGSGKGGQNRNKRDTAVRIIHKESGAIGYSEDERSQLQNKRLAFNRLVESQKFKIWHKKKAFEIMGKLKTKEQLEREVDEMIDRDLENGKIVIETLGGKQINGK